MEFKNSFLSWLFGTEHEQAEETPVEQLPEQPAEQEYNDAPEEPQQPRHELQLPREHAIYRLWAIRNEQAGWLPQPSLCLEGKSDPLMPDDEGRKELVRLQMIVNSTANGRINKLKAQKKEKDGDNSSLPDLDAQAVVFISKDSLTAWLFAYPPVGAGRELDQNAIYKALGEQQVRFGINEALLERLPQDPERYFRLFLVARGKAAVPGTDGRVVDLFPRTPERKLTIDEHNRADYTNLNFIYNVEQGGVICRILPATEGIPGRSVQDQELPAKNGKPASIPKGRNTQLSEDGHTLLASITGHVEFSGRSFQVKPVLDIPGNVDFSVGNINFLGDVCIHGDICSGFTVRAMGNITVAGVVEACTVEAGRDLVVAGGVQGDDQAVIRAQRSIFAKYLENTCVYAKASLEAECIINCKVYCDGSVTVRSGHRSIVGGITWVAHEVSAGIIGSRTERRTEVMLGGQPCGEFDYDMLFQEVQDLEAEIERTERQPDSPSKVSRISRMRMQLMVSQGKLDIINKERELQALEPPDPGLRQMTCDTVFPGTVLTIGDAVYRFSTKTSHCSASLVADEICLV